MVDRLSSGSQVIFGPGRSGDLVASEVGPLVSSTQGSSGNADRERRMGLCMYGPDGMRCVFLHFFFLMRFSSWQLFFFSRFLFTHSNKIRLRWEGECSKQSSCVSAAAAAAFDRRNRCSYSLTGRGNRVVCCVQPAEECDSRDEAGHPTKGRAVARSRTSRGKKVQDSGFANIGRYWEENWDAEGPKRPRFKTIAERGKRSRIEFDR